VTLLLALDTSTRGASVAVHDGEQVVSETTWLAGREHSTRVLVEAEAALARIGRTPADVTGLAVATGPGSFTGVRVAISVAKGMAAALAAPMWGVSTLDVIAHAAMAADVRVCAVVEAGRGRVATALYDRGTGVGTARLVGLAELVTLITVPTFVIGDLSVEARRALAEVPHARLASPAASLRRGGFLAELGVQRMRSGDPGDPHAVDALYLT
jgi:tRNA threonylcarbamoyladenosine biosynthesis protein TsaB